MSEKQLLVRLSNKLPGMYEAYYEDGGELPDKFKFAGWTHSHLAERDIAQYLEERGTKRGTTGSKPRAN
jgi:hypothetical protein